MDARTVFTKRVSNSVRLSMDSAWSAYNDARALPKSNDHNASRLFLYITSWEHAQRASLKWGLEKSISNKHLSYVNNNVFTVDMENTKEASLVFRIAELEKKLDSDHTIKLGYAPPIKYLGQLRWLKPEYLGPDDLKELRELTLYGKPSVIDRRSLFADGWETSDFVAALTGKLNIQRSLMDFSDTKIGKWTYANKKWNKI